jgi:hypothetical protein
MLDTGFIVRYQLFIGYPLSILVQLSKSFKLLESLGYKISIKKISVKSAKSASSAVLKNI